LVGEVENERIPWGWELFESANERPGPIYPSGRNIRRPPENL